MKHIKILCLTPEASFMDADGLRLEKSGVCNSKYLPYADMRLCASCRHEFMDGYSPLPAAAEPQFLMLVSLISGIVETPSWAKSNTSAWYVLTTPTLSPCFVCHPLHVRAY